MDRRRFLRVSGAAGAAGLAGCRGILPDSGSNEGPGNGGSTPTGALPASVGLSPVVTGLSQPVDVAFAPDADRRYVAEQPGTIRVHEAGELRPDPLLDLRDAVVTGYEQGLLGIALHPNFGSNRRLFVRYSAPPRSGTPDDYAHTFVLAEFGVTADGRAVRPGSERTILEIPEPQGNHNAGSIVFGPDGQLFVGVGDGGGAGDRGRGHVDDWYDAIAGGNGQDVTTNLLGSVLRIDVDGSERVRGEQRNYGIPDDNPLVGRSGLDEHYAWGFRNPWRLTIDGDELYAGDVGQNAWEELDLVEKGGNYGWNVREGRHCYAADTCPEGTPAFVRGGEFFVDPVLEYPHGGAPVSGRSIIAGNVYRGDAIPALDGAFVFGDLIANGDLFVATPREDGPWPKQVLPIEEGSAGLLERLFSFQRHDGELYALGSGSDGGGVFRLARGES